MEELLIVLIQFLIEVIGQAVIQIPFDCSCRIKERERAEDSPIAISMVFLVIGGIVGWISIVLIPGTLIEIPALRILNLAITPLLGGYISYRIAQWQYKTQSPNIVPKYHFWYAFFFTLALASVRITYGKH